MDFRQFSYTTDDDFRKYPGAYATKTDNFNYGFSKENSKFTIHALI